jgi:PQQ-like domain
VVQQGTPSQSWTKTVSRFSVAILLAGLVGGCAEPPVFHRNSVAVLPMGSLERSWFVDLQLANDPIVKIDVRDKLVYVYTQSKEVIGFDRKAGTLQITMHVKSPAPHLLPLVELKGSIVFPNSTFLEVFDDEGILQKEIPLDRPLRSDAAGEGHTIYFGSVGPHGGLVEAYDVDEPYAPQEWEFLTRDSAAVTAGISVYNGVVYSASEAGEIDAVSVERSQLWDTDHGEFQTGPVTADLKTDEFGLYIASKDTKLSCVNRATGKLRWQYFAGTPLTDAPITTADSVYQFVPGKGFAALDKIVGPFNRTPRWIHPTATQFLAQDDKYVYLADPRPTADDKGQPGYAIIAVDKQTMKLAFESDHKDFSVFGTNHKDSIIYAGFPDGKFFAIKPVLKAGQIGELVMTPASLNLAMAK